MRRLLAALAMLLAAPAPAFAHALDAYLQAAIIRVEKDRIHVSLRLVPGLAVLPAVMAGIDANRDRVISPAEGKAYAAQVLHDISLSLDGRRLKPRLTASEFPAPQAMTEGLGDIRIDFVADAPAGAANRILVFQNQHQSRIAAYLVNSLVPDDPTLHFSAQRRSADQSVYQLDYRQADGAPAAGLRDPGGFSSMFRLGLRHIAEGADHLLFLLTLLLSAPLVARAGRWAGCATGRESLLKIASVATAFTLGHSLTLALAAYDLVNLPSRPVEVLIAVSILVTAAHALRPLFPGREALIAACFGLIHGLAFAVALAPLGLTGWQRLTAIAGFNLGIEAMQLMVIAAALPSLLLLSRTPAYALARIGGALFAGVAAAGWIAQRLLGWHLPVDRLAAGILNHAALLAACLFLFGLVCWSMRGALSGENGDVPKNNDPAAAIP